MLGCVETFQVRGKSKSVPPVENEHTVAIKKITTLLHSTCCTVPVVEAFIIITLQTMENKLDIQLIEVVLLDLLVTKINAKIVPLLL